MLKALLLPPMALVLAIAVLAVIAVRGRVRLAICALCALLYLGSTPLVGDAALRSLERHPPFTPAMAGDAGAIVVLSAGYRSYHPELPYGGIDDLTLERLRYGAYLSRVTGLPVLTSGGSLMPGMPSLGQVMAQALRDDFGIEARWIDGAAHNTWENAVNAAQLLRADEVEKAIVVTHSWHLARAVDCFAAQNMPVVPAGTAYPTRLDWAPTNLLPSSSGWRNVYHALHEWVGQAYYAVRFGAGPTN